MNEDPMPEPRSDQDPLLPVLDAVEKVYTDIERAQSAFLSSAKESGRPISCPQGCGRCCEPFVPDISQAEAIFAAHWILSHMPQEAAAIEDWADNPPKAPPCPFYRPEQPEAHCGIYPARFMICRLFYASAVRDKEGRPSFRPCAHMPMPGYPEKEGHRISLSQPQLESFFGAQPPVMADFGSQLLSLLPSEASQRASLIQALPAAIAKVGLAISLGKRENHGH